MGQRTLRIVGVSSSSYRMLKNKVLAAEANEGGSWWSAEESQLIKVPTARYSDFSIAGEQLCSEEKRGRKRKGNSIVNACEQGARVSSLQMEANAERRTSGQRGYTQPSTSANESQYGPVPSGGNDWI